MSNETNAELLKRLKADVHTIHYYAGYDGLDKDLLRLIEQVERTQEVEAELKECYKQNNNFSEEHWGLQAEVERLRKELAELKVVKWKNGRPTVIDWNGERWTYSPETMYKGGKRNEN